MIPRRAEWNPPAARETRRAARLPGHDRPRVDRDLPAASERAGPERDRASPKDFDARQRCARRFKGDDRAQRDPNDRRRSIGDLSPIGRLGAVRDLGAIGATATRLRRRTGRDLGGRWRGRCSRRPTGPSRCVRALALLRKPCELGIVLKEDDADRNEVTVGKDVVFVVGPGDPASIGE